MKEVFLLLKLIFLQENENFDLLRSEWFKVMEHIESKIEELKM